MENATGNMLVEHGSTRVESGPERRLIRPALTKQRLQRHGLVRAFNLGMVGGAAFAREAHIDAPSASSHRCKLVGNGEGEVLS